MSPTMQGILLSIITGLLRIGGAALVTRGIVTQDMVDASVPAASQEVLGTALAVGGQAWAMWREKQHQKTVAEAKATAEAALGTVAVIQTAQSDPTKGNASNG